MTHLPTPSSTPPNGRRQNGVTQTYIPRPPPRLPPTPPITPPRNPLSMQQQIRPVCQARVQLQLEQDKTKPKAIILCIELKTQGAGYKAYSRVVGQSPGDGDKRTEVKDVDLQVPNLDANTTPYTNTTHTARFEDAERTSNYNAQSTDCELKHNGCIWHGFRNQYKWYPNCQWLDQHVCCKQCRNKWQRHGVNIKRT
ncbi:hypothetical protein SCHPADRAFT_890021 [Schizopora paradoxa]|uniref:Uncharacterized protein n=1 Tax=Schizopora paradoxa TaxID=27342 RepID=A0A0H2RPH2_9AGAM|nr:hypothetical protein SCHPADRAFT_890021 [Schizopora paradoxa]